MMRLALQAPARKHIVLVGGGHAHVTVVRALAMRPEPGVVVTLIGKELDAPYSGMLPGYVAGHYDYDDVHIDVVRLAAWAGVRLIHGVVTGIDRAARRVLIEGRAPLGYDLLSIDVGITPDLAAIQGADEHAIAVKPVSTFAGRWRSLEQRASREGGVLRIAVVGAGAAGYELVLAIRHRLRERAAANGLDAAAFQFTLIGSAGLLPSHNARARRLARAELRGQGVVLIENDRVTRVAAGEVMLASGAVVAADATLLTTNAGPSAWFRTSGLPVDAKGFIAVRPTLQLMDDDDVFAVGDCASVIEHPREKAGVFAVRQGPPLTGNLRLRARGLAAAPFVPQKDFLTILSSGGEHAIAARNGFAVAGRWVWRWKDRIDREFMTLFNDLSPMMSASTSTSMGSGGSEDMRCAGCAAKVGPMTLARALDRVAGSGAGTRDDAAIVDDGCGDHVGIETIDFFRAFWPEPYAFGEIAATHAMSDVFAMGGAPTRALANIVLPFASPSRTEEDLYQVLAGARAAFDREGVALVGGHSSEGAELAAGFFVSGRAPRGSLLTKGGARPGDRLVLTRAIGTGVLFAALMRTRARGYAIAAALERMRRSNAASKDVLVAHGATAATDVTGFGLAGHLIEMLDAARLGARLDLTAVPLLATALALAGEGIASSLLAENARLSSHLQGAAASDAATLALLFDPQTSGGLLASVPEASAAACLAALHAAGETDARIIGEVTAPVDGAAAMLALLGRLAHGGGRE